MGKKLEENDLLRPPKIGELVQGKIIAKEKNALFLDLGTFGTGIIYGKEFSEAKNYIKDLKGGENIFAKIIDIKNEEGYVELSISQVGKERIWQELQQKKENKEIIPVKILGANNGGLLTEVLKMTAFLPVSQLSSEHYPKIEKGQTTQIFQGLQRLIGEELEVQIIDLDPKIGKIILSERSKDAERIKESLKNYKKGDVVEGEITGILDFGVFIKFGKEGIEGLIHISQLDWQLIEKPSEIVKVGQKVKAQIIDITDDKVFLSLKSLKKDPWLSLEKKYKKGDKIKGKVLKLKHFGALVQVSPKIQALCHISEFGTKNQMEEKIKINEKYDFEILEINSKEHYMNLRLL